MEISLGITTDLPVKTSIGYVQAAERLGYYRVWVRESLTSRELFTYLSVIALKTEKIKIGSLVTSHRDIDVIASSSAGIQDLSENRFTLGLGIGTEKLEVLRETVSSLRKIFKEGLKVPLPILPRIYFEAGEPNLLALAGEIADGVIFSYSGKHLLEGLKILNRATRKAGRNPRQVKKVLWLWNREKEISLVHGFKLGEVVVAPPLGGL